MKKKKRKEMEVLQIWGKKEKKLNFLKFGKIEKSNLWKSWKETLEAAFFLEETSKQISGQHFYKGGVRLDDLHLFQKDPALWNKTVFPCRC